MQRETLLAILLIALVANLALMAVLLLQRRRRARNGGRAGRSNGSAGLKPQPNWTPESRPVDTVALAMLESSVSVDAAGPAQESEPARESAPDALTDAETGLPTSVSWDDAIRAESARIARYRRNATVVVAELDGLDALAARLGQDVADGLIRPVADALRRNARAADRVARVGHARFHVLLPETDEIGAINYIDRVRSSCDLWLEAGALAVRLAIGWASPTTGSLEAALRLAEERMNADRRQGRSDTTSGADPWIRVAVQRPAERARTGPADAPNPRVMPTEA